MSRYTLLAVATVSLGVTPIAAHADIVNASFEDVDADGRITGWNALDDPAGEYLPLRMSNGWGDQPGSDAGLFAAAINWWSYGGQRITLNAGDVVLFDASANTSSGPYFQDDYRLQVWLSPPDRPYPEEPLDWWAPSTPTLWRMYWPSPTPLLGQWITGSLTAPATGEYTLGFQGMAGGFNWGNDNMFVMLDNFRVVPAPGVLAMLGLASPLAARRRRI